jgi:hypothetical protein
MASQAASGIRGECFVVMPFGKKPLPDGRTYDFDKVYRVIITRAVQEVGLKPLRADETVGSRLIHSDMFKDLRDRSIVLADLSLENPNVFYELGIRHVMSPTGTVLMCRKGTDLPFDVRLSRVVFYKFDGDDLDWEEVEETIKALKFALQDAQRNQPDSPVHVLLENVMRSDSQNSPAAHTMAVSALRENLDKYERGLAESWRGKPLSALLEEHSDTVFGLRALGYFCLTAAPNPAEASRVAKLLQAAEQYSLATSIYEPMYAAGQLTPFYLLGYAGAYSEANPNLRGANRAIGFAREALAQVTTGASGEHDAEGVVSEQLAHAYRVLGGLLQWKWQLTKEGSDLAAATEAQTDGLKHMNIARSHGKFANPGYIAQAHLKLMLALRTNSQDAGRPDLEGHGDAIMKIAELPSDDAVSVSYLHWFQAITLADLGADDEANAKALDQLARDASLSSRPDCFEIGRRQYVLLRRFIEGFGSVLRHPKIMGRISRHLYMGLRKSQ